MNHESKPDNTNIRSRPQKNGNEIETKQYLHGGCQKVGPKVAKFLDR